MAGLGCSILLFAINREIGERLYLKCGSNGVVLNSVGNGDEYKEFWDGGANSSAALRVRISLVARARAKGMSTPPVC